MKKYRRSILASTIIAFSGCSSISSRINGSTESQSPEPADCTVADSPVWASFQGDRQNTGAAEMVPELESKPDVRTIADGFASHPVSAVLDENAIYLVDSTRVSAIDRDDGSRQWTYRLDDFANPRPALACGTVLVQTGLGVHGIDAEEGTERWRVEAGNAIFAPAIAVTDDRAAVGAGGVSMIDVATGTTTWQSERDESCLGLAMDDRTVYATSVDFDGKRGVVAAYDIETGDRRWTFDELEFEGRSFAFSNPVVGDELVFVLDRDTGLRALDDDGTTVWNHSFGRLTANPQPALHPDGTLVVNVGNDRETLAIDAATGDVRWRTPMASFGSEYVLIGGDIAYVDTGDSLKALSIDDGTKLWRLTDVRANDPLAATGQSILVAGSPLRELTPADR